MKINSSQLLEDLRIRTEIIIKTAKENFLLLPDETIQKKPTPERWSIAECLEHLNLYGEYYIPTMMKVIDEGQKKGLKPKEYFKPGLVGNYFSESMMPNEGKTRKIKTFNDKDPSITGTRQDVLERFLDQQEEFLKILTEASKVDLEKVKVPITIAKWIKLKLGDTLRFNIYHNERHLWQAKKVMQD